MISELTGQVKVVEDILGSFDFGVNLRHLLSGPSGSGKSWVVREIARQWRHSGNAVYVTTGDLLNSKRSYYPFFATPNEFVHRQDSESLKMIMSEGGKSIPGFGHVISATLHTLFQREKTRRRRETLYLSDVEFEILHRIETADGKRPILLIAENFHWWDENSLECLKVLLSTSLWDIYPSLIDLHCIFVVTEDQTAVVPLVVSELLNGMTPTHHSLKHVAEAEFAKILKAFGYSEPLSDKARRFLFAICGGNLHTMRCIAQDLSERRYELRDLSENSSSARLSDVALHGIELRLRQITSSAPPLLHVLRAASVVGLSFSDADVQCVTKLPDAQIVETLKQAQLLSLVERQETNYTFGHEVLRDYFVNWNVEDGYKYNEAYAECLRLTRPGEYAQRAMHLELAGKKEQASELHLITRLQQWRRGTVREESRPKKELLRGESGSLGQYERNIMKAYENYFSHYYEACISDLQRIEDLYSNLLLAERDYLLSLALMKGAGRQKRARACEILSDWRDCQNSEGEQWARLMSSLLIGYIHTDRYDEARRIERELMKYYAGRVQLDQQAEVGINILRRKSNAIHAAEIAAERTLQAADFFGPLSKDGPPHNPVEFFMALSNLSGNLLVSGKFEEAFEYARVAIDVFEKHSLFRLHGVEKPINNFVLASYLSDRVSPAEAARILAGAIELAGEGGDSILVRNNRAVLSALGGDLGWALQEFQALAKQIEDREIEDSFYLYFIRSNLIALLFLSGDKTDAISRWSKLEDAIPFIAEADRVFLIRRHEMQKQAFERIEAGDIEGWHTYLQKNFQNELGRPWQFYGRGFLVSDLQFWSES